MDTFASPGNTKCSLLLSGFPHREALAMDALKAPLDPLRYSYALPNWGFIQDWAIRLPDNTHLTCLPGIPLCACWLPLVMCVHVPHTPLMVVGPQHGKLSRFLGSILARTKSAPSLYVVFWCELQAKGYESRPPALFLPRRGERYDWLGELGNRCVGEVKT